jgi:DNA gyrase subunit B
MPEIIERGHLYIAQPPLYKIKKGNIEYYVKDDETMKKHQMDIALDGAELYIKNNVENYVYTHELAMLIKKYNKIKILIQSIKNNFPSVFLYEMLYNPILENLKDKKNVKIWIKNIIYQLNNKSKNNFFYTYDIEFEKENKCFLPILKIIKYGLVKTYKLEYLFFCSKEYQQICQLSKILSKLIKKEVVVIKDNITYSINNLEKLLNDLISNSQKNISIQRYKGLGEMNPSQLWETTMNPVTRRMLQVKIKDACSANKLFSTLMGDSVEPRKRFIDQHALQVLNIDI